MIQIREAVSKAAPLELSGTGSDAFTTCSPLYRPCGRHKPTRDINAWQNLNRAVFFGFVSPVFFRIRIQLWRIASNSIVEIIQTLKRPKDDRWGDMVIENGYIHRNLQMPFVIQQIWENIVRHLEIHYSNRFSGKLLIP